MEIYTAIMQAADHIECRPGEFDFRSTVIPANPGCGTPGCAYGWIGGFLGVAENGYGFSKVAALLGAWPAEFYGRMDEICPEGRTIGRWGIWARDPRRCAAAMRVYAAKYHAPPKVSPPDWNALAGQWTVGDDVRSQELA